MDVDKPRTWPLRLQGHFWAGTGPAATIRGRYKKPPFGSSIKWLDPEARVYWASILGIGDGAPYPQPDYPVPFPQPQPNYPAPGDDKVVYCTNCGAANQFGANFCFNCGNRV